MTDTERKPEQRINRVYQIIAVLLLVSCPIAYMSLYFHCRSTLQPYDLFARFGWPLFAILLIGTLIYRLPFRLVLAGEVLFGVGYAVCYGILLLGSNWSGPWGILLLISLPLLLIGALMICNRFLPPNKYTEEFIGATLMLTALSILMPI